MKQLKVGISYGFAEGPGNARRMIKFLKQSGFSITRKLHEADIIIAHSGGCFLIPENGRANIVMMIDLPYWPGKHPRIGFKEKLKLEPRDRDWLKKSLINFMYFFAWPNRWYRMYKAWGQVRVPSKANYPSIIAVRDEHDTFMHPIESEALAEKHGWHTHTLRGEHDDLWANPRPYIDILLKKLQETE